MKMKTTKGVPIDTDKMTDKEAEIYEAVGNLLNVCSRYKVPMFCRVITKKGKYCGTQTFGQKKSSDMDFMLELINDYTKKVTKGKVVMVKME